MIHNKLMQITIDTPGFAKVFINLVARHHNLPDLIVSNWDSVFTFKFWFSGTNFELNCGYHQRVPYKKDTDPRSKFD